MLKHELQMVSALEAQHPHITFTPTQDKFSKWDLTTDRAIIELKTRRGNNSRFEDTFIEQIKYDALLDEAERTGKKALYVVYREWDHTIYVFDLSATDEPTWNNVPMRAKTDFGCNKRVYKPVGKLYYDEAAQSFPVSPITH